MSASAPAPADSPRARWLAVLVGVALLAASGVAVREFVVWYWKPAGWNSWLAPLPELLSHASPQATAIAGIGAVTLGLILMVSALRPRKRRYVRIDGPAADIWLRPVDLARFSTASAKTLPGVVTASTLARKDRVIVDVAGRELSHDAVFTHIESAVHRAFGPDMLVNVSLREATEEDEL